MKKLLYLLIALLLVSVTRAQDTPIHEANDFYQKGEYEKAIKSYEFVLETHIEAPEIYFNLANSYYKTGQIAPAILNYERAKLLSPEDEDIQYNLKMTQAHVLDKLEILPELFIKRWVSGIRNAFSADLWSYLSIGLFFLCLLFACFYLYSNKVDLKKVGFFFSGLSLLLSILTYSFASIKTDEITNRKYAIIFSPSVTIKGSPDVSGTELFLLHEGTKVKVTETLGNWLNIQLIDGNKGWIEKENIEMI